MHLRPQPRDRAEPAPEPPPPSSPAPRTPERLVPVWRRRWVWLVLLPFLLLAAVAVLDAAIDRPLRGYLERQANARLTGYAATIRAVDFSPWNFSLDLFDVTIVQQAHPDPPVAQMPRLNLNVQWRSLLFGRIVADMRVDSPRFFVSLPQLEEELDDQVDLEERGWQQALLAIYPLRVNELVVVDGSVTYIQEKEGKPLHLTKALLVARDIRNVETRPGVYPSPVHFESAVFDTGRAVFDGHANFLLEPYAGVHVIGTFTGIPLDRLDPLIEGYHVHIEDGLLSAAGRVEWSPTVQLAHLGEVVLQGIKLDYVSSPATQDEEAALKKAAVDAAEEVTEDSTMLLRMDVLRIVDSTFAYVSRFGDPGYRAFLSGADVTLENLSNRYDQGEARLRGSGAFMGSGKTVFAGTFRPDRDGADFDVDVKIEGTDMRAMNDMFRTYANVDVSGGRFSFYSEVRVQDGAITGYVKPLFEEVNVYTRAQDRKKGLFKRIWEGIVEGVANLLENRRDEVATVARLQGTVSNPRASNWEVVAGLIENAFFDAILPGFERELSWLTGRGGRRDRDDRKAQDRKEKSRD
jgi:hypothetical protein